MNERANPEPTTVIAEQAGRVESIEVLDNYVLVCDGTCYRDSVVVHRRKDGTETHVITIKGIRQ